MKKSLLEDLQCLTICSSSLIYAFILGHCSFKSIDFLFDKMILEELIILEPWLPIELDIFDRGPDSNYLSTSDAEKHEFSVTWIQISCNNDVIKCGPVISLDERYNNVLSYTFIHEQFQQ